MRILGNVDGISSKQEKDNKVKIQDLKTSEFFDRSHEPLDVEIHSLLEIWWEEEHPSLLILDENENILAVLVTGKIIGPRKGYVLVTKYVPFPYMHAETSVYYVAYRYQPNGCQTRTEIVKVPD